MANLQWFPVSAAEIGQNWLITGYLGRTIIFRIHLKVVYCFGHRRCLQSFGSPWSAQRLYPFAEFLLDSCHNRSSASSLAHQPVQNATDHRQLARCHPSACGPGRQIGPRHDRTHPAGSRIAGHPLSSETSFYLPHSLWQICRGGLNGGVKPALESSSDFPIFCAATSPETHHAA